MARNKIGVSYRLSALAIRLVSQLAEKLGVSQAAVMEMAIRKMAEAEGIETKEEVQPDGR